MPGTRQRKPRIRWPRLEPSDLSPGLECWVSCPLVTSHFERGYSSRGGRLAPGPSRFSANEVSIVFARSGSGPGPQSIDLRGHDSERGSLADFRYRSRGPSDSRATTRPAICRWSVPNHLDAIERLLANYCFAFARSFKRCESLLVRAGELLMTIPISSSRKCRAAETLIPGLLNRHHVQFLITV